MKKTARGMYGYLSYKKKSTVITTIILFLVPLALFIAGLVTTKTRLNVLTIVAILGMLPACQFAVNAFMYLKAKGFTKEEYDECKAHVESLLTAYDNVFTTYDATYEVPVLVVKNQLICGYLSNAKDNGKKLEEHIKTSAMKEGIQVTVNMITKKETFIKRVDAIKQEEKEASAQEQAILKLLFDISL